MIFRSLPIALMTCCVGVACTPIRMVVAPDLTAGAEMLQVVDRSSWSGRLVDESFRFGPYRVTAVDRNWATGAGWRVGAYHTDTMTGGYQFVVEAPTGTVAGRCGTEVLQTSAQIFGRQAYSARESLACACGPDATGSRFVLRSAPGGAMAGALLIGGAEVALQPVRHLEGGYAGHEAFGYQAQGREVLAGVEVVKPGRVWLARSLVPAAAADMACLAAGLLLYMPPQAEP